MVETKGTVVRLMSDPVREHLLEDEFNHVSMIQEGSDERLAEAARLLEIFPDVQAMHAARDAPHLLDRRYANLLGPEERDVAAEPAALLPRVLAFNRRSEAWQPVADALSAWCARAS